MPKLEELIPKIKKVLKQQPVVLAYIFGSYAKGKTGKMSDLDIAVYFNKRVNDKQARELVAEIKDELEIVLAKRDGVDVIYLNEAPPFLEHEIVYQGQLIYNIDNNIRAQYESAAVGRWLDWKWYQDQFDQAIEQELGKPIKAKYKYSYA